MEDGFSWARYQSSHLYPTISSFAHIPKLKYFFFDKKYFFEVSHGIKCAYPNLPGVYMRMTFYKPWIERVTGENFS